MNDLINREAAINTTNITWEEILRHDPLNVMTEIRERIRALPPAQQWIPVSERLPKERMAVLVYAPKYKNIYCATLQAGGWWIFGAYYTPIMGEVVAWMPLPKPYKEGKHE